MSKETVVIKFVSTKVSERPRIKVEFGSWYTFEAELPDRFIRDLVSWWKVSGVR